MYFGSVRFFKHLILTVLAAIIILPLLFAIHYGVAYSKLQAQVNALKQEEAAKTAPSLLAQSTTARGGLIVSYASQAENEKASQEDPALSYQRAYPQLYVENDFQYQIPEQKTVYLTFDDGPSSLTGKVLDILKANDIKATFFIVYKDSADAQALYKRMIAEGHTVGVHSTTHEYKTVYASIDSYLEDFAKTAIMLKDVTGVKPEIFRFPGGSINVYNSSLYMQLIAEMTRRGYTYYDWNVSSGDTAPKKSSATIYQNVVNGVREHRESIVLLHDLASHNSTLDALPKIIDTLKTEGYVFESLNKDVTPITFSYKY